MRQYNYYKMIVNIHQKPIDGNFIFESINTKELENKKQGANEERSLMFYSFAEPFKSIDYPSNDQSIFILSSGAIALADSMTNEDYVLTRENITVIDGLLDENDPRIDSDEDGVVKLSLENPRYYTDDFFIVTLPILSDVFDYENSVYEKHEDGELCNIKKYAFYEEKVGSTHLFKIPEHLGYVFVSHELRQLWRNHKVTGMAYIDLDKPFDQYQIDVEVSNPNIPE